MRNLNDSYSAHMLAASREPRFTVRVDFASDFTDPVYILSHTDSAYPVSADILANSLISGSAISQELKEIAGIGGITLKFLDNSGALSDKLKTKLEADKGIRLKRVRVYSGFKGMVWGDYEIEATAAIGSLSYQDKVYTLKSEDIQRIAKDKKLFPETFSNLYATLSATETSLIRVGDNSVYTLVDHGSSYSDAPNQEVFYVKIEDEIIRCSGVGSDGTSDYLTIDTGGRGLFQTVAVEHQIDSGRELNRQPKVEEFVYLELPVVKLLYAVQLGGLYGQTGKTLPPGWCLTLDATYVTTDDFTGIGDDLWDTTDDSKGVICRFMGLRNINAKEFIEEELLPMIGCFMPVYSDGSHGLKRNVAILPNFIRDTFITSERIMSHGALEYDFKNLKNKYRIKWHWSAYRQDYQLTTTLVYTDSIAKHQETDFEEKKFRGVFANNYTDETIANLIDLWASDKVYPQWRFKAKLLPNSGDIEIGDTPYIYLETLVDFAMDTSVLPHRLSRSMKVTKTSRDLLSGEIDCTFQASSSAIPPYATFTSAYVLPDSYYDGSGKGWTSLSTEIGAALSGNTIISNCSLTGAATPKNIYHLGNLTVNAGVTVAVYDNVRLWVRGIITNNESFNGVGRGPTGSTGSYGRESATLEKVDTLGNVRSVGGFDDVDDFDGTFECVPLRGSAKEGKILKNLNITYDGTDLLGIPSELRGTPGTAGTGVKDNGVNKALGGDGGAGGAGLAIIARGFVSGVSSEVNLSGGANSVGGSYEIVTNSYDVVGGSGCPGAPGGFLCIIDGPALSLPDEANVTVNYGNFNTNANYDVERNLHTLGSNPGWFYDGNVPSLNSTAVTNEELTVEQVFSSPSNLINANFQTLYIKDNTPKDEPANDYAPSAPVGFGTISSGDSDLLNLNDGTIISRINLNWTASTDTQVSHYEIYYKKTTDSNYIKLAEQPKRDETQVYIPNVEDGATYDLRVKAINIFGFESTSINTTETVTGKTAAPGNPTSVTATAIVDGIIIDGTAPSDTDLAGVEIWRNTTNDTGSASRIDTVNALPSKQFGFTDSSVTSADGALYYWVRAVDTSRLPGSYVAATGTPITADDPDWADLANIPEGQIYNTDDSTALGFNPSFSAWAGTYPDGWSAYSNVPTKELIIVNTGNYSAKYTTNGVSNYGFLHDSKSQAFSTAPLPVGGFIVGSFSYYLDAITGSGRPGLFFDLYYGATTYRRTYIEIDNISTGAWHTQPFIARVNPGEQIWGIRINVIGSHSAMPNGHSNCTVYFDNVGFNILHADAVSLDDGTRINDIRPSIMHSAFIEEFEQPHNWTDLSGSGTESYPADANMGGLVYQVAGGQRWLEFPVNIPFDPDRLYKIQVKVRMTAAPTDSAKDLFYCGVNGIAIDGTTRVDQNGLNTTGNQFFIAAHAVDMGGYTLSQWQTFTGYYKGIGTYIGNASDPQNPSGLHADVRYFRPMVIVNHNHGDGTMQVDAITIESTSDWDEIGGANKADDNADVTGAHIGETWSEDLVIDGDMERSDVTYWSGGSKSATAKYGSYSLYISTASTTVRNQDAAGTVIYVPVEEGDKIHVGAWIRHHSIGAGFLYIEWYNGVKTYLSESSLSSIGVATFTYLSGNATAPANARYAVLKLYTNSSASSGAYFDAVTMRRLDITADNTQTEIDNGLTTTTGSITNTGKGAIDLGQTGVLPSIWINSATWQASGVQIQYNSGTPRMYVGDGGNKYMQFDGTNFSLGNDVQLLGADAFNNNTLYDHNHCRSTDGFSEYTAGSLSYIDVLSGTGIRLAAGDSGTVNSEASFGEYLHGESKTFANEVRSKFRVRLAGWTANCQLKCVFAYGSSSNIGFIVDGSNNIKVFCNDGSTTETVDSGVNLNTVFTNIEVIYDPSLFSPNRIKLKIGSTTYTFTITNYPSTSDSITILRDVYLTKTGGGSLAYVYISDMKTNII